MTNYNARNERIKKQYYEYLQESKGRSEKTLNQVRNSLFRFEEYNKFKDFGTFNKEQAIAFKKFISKQKNKKGEIISKSTLLHIITNLKQFFNWLVCQQGYRSKIKLTDIDYFNLLENDKRAAKARKIVDFPTMEQVRKVIFSLPETNDIQRRDKALIAFTILTGIRDNAIASLKIKHVDIYKKLVFQDPNEVRTKNSKLIYTFFFPVGEDVETIVIDWINYLTTEKLFGVNDPLFPKTKLGHDENSSFKAIGLTKEHWQSTSQIREIFKTSFEAYHLPYFNPHSFRNTLTSIAEMRCNNMQQLKAWSQNLGHSSINTTLISYGEVPFSMQGDLIRGT
jgi:integrase/recombinase XerD